MVHISPFVSFRHPRYTAFVALLHSIGRGGEPPLTYSQSTRRGDCMQARLSTGSREGMIYISSRRYSSPGMISGRASRDNASKTGTVGGGSTNKVTSYGGSS